jgi:hypothetical protein
VLLLEVLVLLAELLALLRKARAQRVAIDGARALVLRGALLESGESYEKRLHLLVRGEFRDGALEDGARQRGRAVAVLPLGHLEVVSWERAARCRAHPSATGRGMRRSASS